MQLQNWFNETNFDNLENSILCFNENAKLFVNILLMLLIDILIEFTPTDTILYPSTQNILSLKITICIKYVKY